MYHLKVCRDVFPLLICCHYLSCVVYLYVWFSLKQQNNVWPASVKMKVRLQSYPHLKGFWLKWDLLLNTYGWDWALNVERRHGYKNFSFRHWGVWRFFTISNEGKSVLKAGLSMRLIQVVADYHGAVLLSVPTLLPSFSTVAPKHLRCSSSLLVRCCPPILSEGQSCCI